MHFLDLYLNADKPEGQQCLLRSSTSMDPLSSWPILLGDCALCRLWFLRASPTFGAAPSTVDVLDEGEQMLFGAKLGSSLDAEEFVIGATGWTKVADGALIHFEQVVVFDTAALRAGFTSSAQPSVTLTGAVRLLGSWAADNQPKLTYQFAINCARGVISGDEGISANANPSYPLPNQLVTTGGLAETLAAYAENGDIRIPDRDNGDILKRLVIKDGELQLEAI